MLRTLFGWFFVLLEYGTIVWNMFTTPLFEMFENASAHVDINNGLALAAAETLELIFRLIPDITLFDFIFGSTWLGVFAVIVIKFYTDIVA